MAKQTKEFRGKTETDIEVQFTAWLQRMAGQIRDVERGPFNRLPLQMRASGGLGSLEAQDAFSMLVEYELIGLIDDDEPKPKFRKLNPSRGGSRAGSTAQKKRKAPGRRSDRRIGANPTKRKKRPHKRGRRS